MTRAYLFPPTNPTRAHIYIRYLQDGMQNHWGSSYISHILDYHLSSHPASIVSLVRVPFLPLLTSQVITFDLYGITNHPNHIALAHGCSFGPHKIPRTCFALQSPSLLFKFTGPFWTVAYSLQTRLYDAFGRASAQKGTKRRVTFTTDVSGWIKGAKAMKEHRSQLVWFRYLYFAFSRLVWHNELEELLEHG